MEILIQFSNVNILVLPMEGKILGPQDKTGIRKEIYKHRDRKGYCRRSQNEPKVLDTSSRNRLIWSAVNGPIPKGMQINHKNHDRADDRINNLELATAQQNLWYRQKSKYRKFKGVLKQGTKFYAQLVVNGKSAKFGPFLTEEEAALAYDKAALVTRGKFAVLNFPSND